MCHTDFMKKSLLLFAPLLICLISCDELRFGYTKEEHSAGFDNGRSVTSENANKYTYFSGDTIDFNNPNVAHLTFDHESAQSNMAKEDIASLIHCDIDNFFNEVVEASYVGVKQGVSLFIGVDSSYIDGYLTLSFNHNIKDIIIKACPYYSDEIIGFENRIEHDSLVGVSVNDSSYYKLNYSINNETNEVSYDEACFHLNSDNVTQIKIKAGPQRAIINEICLYY